MATATITLDEIRALRQRLILDAAHRHGPTDAERAGLVSEMRIYTTMLHTGDMTDWHEHVEPAEPGCCKDCCDDCGGHLHERWRYGQVDICQHHVTARLRTRRRLELNEGQT